MIKKILFCHAIGKPKKVINAFLREDNPKYWIFLCQDYLQFLKWKNELGDNFQFIKLNPNLQEVAQRLRLPFLNLITELGRQYNCPAWWASRLSERNTMVSSLFLYCCYLNVVQEQIQKLSGTLCVVSESWAVIEALAVMARGCGCEVKCITKCVAAKRKLTLLCRIIIQTLRMAYKAVNGKLTSQDSYLPQSNQPCIFIHTYIDEACFGKDGFFHDRYFPGLCEWLEKNGCSVFTIPVLFNLKRSDCSAWKWFRGRRQKFVNPFKLYRLSDYIFAIKESWNTISIPDCKVILNGLDVTQLFDAERERYAFDCLQAILYLRLPKRLVEAGFRVDAVIAEYENMIPEKMLILGFHHYIPSAKLVGFQHGSLYPFMLCNFVTHGEAGFAPLPDRVVCNGEFSRDILIREGLPPERTVIGPALRYAHLWNLASEKAVESGKPFDVFVPLPLVIDAGVELLVKLIKAFEHLRNLRIILKLHPMSSRKELLGFAEVMEIPSHFKFVEGSMFDWLYRARVVISLSSSTIHEVLAAGVPLVVVGREAAIDLNPLGFYADFNRVFCSPEEIRIETLRLLSLSSEELSQYSRRGKDVLQVSFNPVTDDSMRFFVDGLVKGFEPSR